MAQASEVPTPKASQFIFDFIKRSKDNKKATLLQKITPILLLLPAAYIKPSLHHTFAPQLYSMSKKKIFYIGFFVALALIFYFVLTLIIPGYAKKGVSPISFIRPFSFTTQDGKSFTDKDVAGKVFVADYFFTSCKGICPKMNNNMKLVYEAFKNEPGFLILSHTCDPDRDSVAQIKKYTDSLGIDTKRWIFLTGRKDSLYNMARVSYTIDDPADNLISMEDDFMHSQLWALVDQNGDVRKIYDGLKESEVNDLITDIKKLLKNN